MDIMDFITTEAIILIPVLNVLGTLIKKSTLIKDEYIPSILLIAGCTLSVFQLGLNTQGLVQGILVTGASVLGHQLVKQSKE